MICETSDEVFLGFVRVFQALFPIKYTLRKEAQLKNTHSHLFTHTDKTPNGLEERKEKKIEK